VASQLRKSVVRALLRPMKRLLGSSKLTIRSFVALEDKDYLRSDQWPTRERLAATTYRPVPISGRQPRPLRASTESARRIYLSSGNAENGPPVGGFGMNSGYPMTKPLAASIGHSDLRAHARPSLRPRNNNKVADCFKTVRISPTMSQHSNLGCPR
jgi:hypothetical protein